MQLDNYLVDGERHAPQSAALSRGLVMAAPPAASTASPGPRAAQRGVMLGNG